MTDFSTVESLKRHCIEVFREFTLDNSEIDGVTFIRIFDEFPDVYKVYYTKKKVLTFSKVIDYDYEKHEEGTTAMVFIDADTMYKGFSEDPTVVTFESQYLPTYFVSDVGMITMGSSKGASIYSMNIYIVPGKFNEFKDRYSKYFVVSIPKNEHEFGVARVDPTSGQLETYYYPMEKKVYKYDKKNYNDDFEKVYKRMCEILSKDDETALMLLYGKPGTGKTTIIKHLISKYKDIQFVLIDGYMLNSISNAHLIDYFSENKNTVFVIEDCERIIRSRDLDYNNNVMSVLLNITGGILGDSLGLKFICTFNTNINDVDKALLRPGRCSLKYEFKPLTKEKSQAIDPEATGEKTLAELYNKEENDFSKQEKRRAGFI